MKNHCHRSKYYPIVRAYYSWSLETSLNVFERVGNYYVASKNAESLFFDRRGEWMASQKSNCHDTDFFWGPGRVYRQHIIRNYWRAGGRERLNILEWTVGAMYLTVVDHLRGGDRGNETLQK